jgi:hypothetical protein
MTLTVLLGDDDICARQLQHMLRLHDGVTVERLDAAENTVIDIVAGVLSHSLFSPAHVVVIDQLDKLTGANLDLFISAVSDSMNHLYAIAKSLTPTQRKMLTNGLGEMLNVREYPALDGKRAHETVDIIAASADISLSRQVRQLLIERAGHEPARLQSVIEQCRIGGIKNPSAAQIIILCGTTSSAGVPWGLSEHLERGELQAALEVCSAAVPLATLAYLGNRYQHAMRIFESGASNPEEAARTLGSKSVYTAERLLVLSRRVGRKRLEKIILIIAEGDLLAKQHGIDGLRIVIGRLAPLLSERRTVSR